MFECKLAWFVFGDWNRIMLSNCVLQLKWVTMTKLKEFEKTQKLIFQRSSHQEGCDLLTSAKLSKSSQSLTLLWCWVQLHWNWNFINNRKGKNVSYNPLNVMPCIKLLATAPRHREWSGLETLDEKIYWHQSSIGGYWSNVSVNEARAQLTALFKRGTMGIPCNLARVRAS